MADACDRGEHILQLLLQSFILHEVCQGVAALSTGPVAHSSLLSELSLTQQNLPLTAADTQHRPVWCSTVKYWF